MHKHICIGFEWYYQYVVNEKSKLQNIVHEEIFMHMNNKKSWIDIYMLTMFIFLW